MIKVKIYILRDPRNNQIRYLGKTNRTLETRLYYHLNDKNKSRKVNWITQLKKLNLKPIIECIDEVSSNEWIFWEKFWITILKILKCDLTNLTNGGEGTQGYIPSKELVEKRITHLRKKIRVYDIYGNDIKVCNSIHEAAKEFNVQANHISQCASGKYPKIVNKKYVFRFIEDSFHKYDISNKKKKQILQMDMQGNPIKKWNSIQQAAHFFGVKAPNISRVLRGERKHFRNFTWSYCN